MPALRSTIIVILLLLPVFLFAQETSSQQETSSSEPESAQNSETEQAAAEVDIDELRQRVLNEAPNELMSLALGNSKVSLLITGSWMGHLQANFGFAVSPLGTSAVSPESPILFKQEADLTLSLWINDKWFVEANFLDDSAMNTYRAGYQGQEGEFVEYAGIGNTGLDFPSFAYLDLGGDTPSSFGFYSRLGNRDLKVHTLFRYDAAARDEKIFYGGRERTFSFVNLQNSIQGISFVLPDTNIDSNIQVYIEDEEGSLRDADGRRWRLAAPSEYSAGRTDGFLELSIRPEGMVAVSYSKGGMDSPWNSSVGTYLNEIQNWFDPSRTKIDLSKYGTPREVSIGGVAALVVREPGIFSPFERQNRYEAPSSNSERAELVNLSSGTAISGFQLLPSGANTLSADIPTLDAVESRLYVYELLPAKGVLNQRSAETIFPLAREYPEIYLPSSGTFTGDAGIRFTNFGSAEGFFLGTDVVPGSVQVWRSGIQDTNFNFNAASGEVTLTSAAGASELIRITFLKRSDETRLGSIAAGIGAVYNRAASPFSAEAAVGLRWNLTEADSFTEEGQSSPGTVGISAKTALDFDYLKSRVTAGFAFRQNDTTGLYRAAGMEGNERALALPPDTSFISNPPTLVNYLPPFTLDENRRADLIFRNYFDSSGIGSTLMNISWNGATVVSGRNRPYPVKDSSLGDYQLLAAEFVLSGAKNWTGFQVPLGFDAELLSRAGVIEIPFRLYGFSENIGADFKLIVQIGSLSGDEFAYNENPALIWEQELFSSGGSVTGDEARLARFVLNEEDRLRLADAKYLRIISVYEGGIGEELSGRVLLAPPIVRGAAFRAVTFDGENVMGIPDFSGRNNVTAAETIDNTLQAQHGEIIRRLHPSSGTQRVLKIDWENMQPNISAGVDGRVGELPLADYRAMSFFVKAPSGTNANETLSFIVGTGPSSISDNIQLEARVPLSAFKTGQWAKVTIRYQGDNSGIEVDGADISGAEFKYRRMARNAALNTDDTGANSSYIAVLVNPKIGALPDASISIDEIILEDSGLFYRINAGAAIEYSRPGTLFSIGETAVLSDFSISNTMESEFRADPANNSTETEGSVVNRSGLEVSILGAQVTGNLLFTAAKEDFLWSADHGISKKIGAFSAEEKFSASPSDNSARHSFNLDFSSPFFAKFNADANYDFSRRERKWIFGMGYKSAKSFIPSLSVNAEAAWTKNNEKIKEDENYASLWARTWETMIPDFGEEEDLRKTLTQIILDLQTKPIGFNLTAEGRTFFSYINNNLRLENSLFLDIPVMLNKINVNSRAGRTFIRQLNFLSKDALEDGKKFFESINDSLPLWGVFPGYSLFANEPDDAMDKALESSPSFSYAQYTGFNDHFSTRISLPGFYNLASFVIPSGASVRLERLTEQKLDTRSDVLNLGASVSYSSVNMFGAMGYLPLFKFYQGDEYNHVIDAAFLFPKDEDFSWRIQSVAGASFKGFKGAEFNFVNTLTLRSNWDWTESAFLDWTVPVKKSLLGVFYNYVAAAALKQSSWLTLSKILNSEREMLRSETLELAIDKTEEDYRMMLALGHESIIRITGRLNFSTFIKLRFKEESAQEIFTVDGLIGTILRVSF